MTLRELRKQNGLTQQQCAQYLGVPLRTYQNYETDETKRGTIKYLYLLGRLERYGYIDEEHGLLSVGTIEEVCGKVLPSYGVDYCYLFGSYAKGTAKPESDVDLFVSADVTGLKFYELTEVLRENLKKKVEVLNQNQIKDNFILVNEILKDGIKIYG